MLKEDSIPVKEVSMASWQGINRRDFLKLGIMGTASAMLESGPVANAFAAQGPFVFPKPVYRTLGRTGLKVSIVSFGAMLTPEPEVIR